MNYKSFDDLSKTVIGNISKIPSEIDLIVGVPRSGLLAANLIAVLLNKPLTDFDGYFENRLISCGKTKNVDSFIKNCNEAKHVLIVEDSICSGASIDRCRTRIEEQKIEEVEFLFCAVYAEDKEMAKKVDIYFEIISSPRIFEWNLFHHCCISQSCFDIDGVLCDDPSDFENDDGPNYRSFLHNAKPKILPTQKIGALVTSRLKKYETETVDWLKRHYVDFDRLVMMDSTFEERRISGNHGLFKGTFYKNSNYMLFVESEPSQAVIINQIAKKPVYCVGNGVFYDGNTSYKLIYETKMKLKFKIRRFFTKFSLGRYMLEIYKRLKSLF